MVHLLVNTWLIIGPVSIWVSIIMVELVGRCLGDFFGKNKEVDLHL